MPIDQETDSDVIAEQAYAEMEAEKNGTPLPEKKKLDANDEKPSEEKPSDDAAKPSEETVKEVVEGQEEAKPEDEKPKEEGELNADGTPKAKETPKEETPSDAKIIEDYAVKNNLTYGEAKDELASVKALTEKYKNDPVELAKALRSTQSAYDKTKAQLGEKPKEKLFQRLSDEQFIAQARTHLSTAKDKDAQIEAYRERFPNKTENMTDEAIIEEMAEKALVGYKSFADNKESELKQKAVEKRDALLNSIPEADKKFIPDVKAVLLKTRDFSILDPDFDVKDIVNWAKGQRYEADIKDAYARGLKAGKEGAVIVGAKDVSGKSTVKTGQAQTTWAGTEDQKKRAVEMFPTEDTGSEEKSYQLFRETYEEELKKNPKFF